VNVYQVLLYHASQLVVGPVVSRMVRLKCEGLENVPAEGGALIVSNHRSLMDPLSIGMCVERQINFAAGSFAFSVPLVGPIFKAWGVIPLNVFGGEKSKQDLETAVKLLEDGELVGVFPEGVHTLAHPHRVSRIQTFRTGFARVALRARVPIIPVAVIGLGERNLPKVPYSMIKPFFDHPDFRQGVQWIYYRRVHVRIGRPFDLAELYDEEMTKSLIDQVSGKVRRVIIKLYNGEDLDRFLTGERPFDIAYDRV
jgi:1-acyl-sn-glycerol-3-phosphate acyltransferase